MFGTRSWWNRSRQARPWARRVGTLLMVGVMTAGVFVSLDAEARRMGGGRSFGRQSQMAPRTPPPAQQPMHQAAPAQGQRGMPPGAQPNRSRWMAPLAGLAAGLGIAALLSHFGLGGALASMMANVIVIALIAMVAIWLIRKLMNRRTGQAPAYAGRGSSSGLGGGLHGGTTNRMNSGAEHHSPGWSSSGSHYAGEAQRVFGGNDAGVAAPLAAVPAGFDSETLLRNAKVHFVRLQAAWDRGDMADIREFTTPEMYAEIKIDLDARGTEPNHTDVVQLNAELLSVEEKGSECFASVRFHGLIRESEHAPTTLFEEVWNLTKPRGEGWLLAGIQQVDVH